MATVVTLDDIIGGSNKELLEIFKKDYRAILDQKITILDLSYEALKVNVYRNTKAHIETYNAAYTALRLTLDNLAKRKYSCIEDVPVGYFQKKNFSFVYIDNGDSNRFIIANSFGALDTLVRKLSRDPLLEKTSFGVNTIFKELTDNKGRLTGDSTKSFRRKSDIGHIATIEEDNLTSPLELKIADIMQYGTTSNNKIIENLARTALNELYNIQATASYSFKNTAPEAISSTQSILGTGYLVVTLHRQKLNNKFSVEEARIFYNLKSKIAKLLSGKDFHLVAGSNNILQDITQGLLHSLNPKQFPSPKSHDKKSPIAKTLTTLANSVVSSKVVKVQKSNPIRTTSGQFYSLATLQMLINSHLQNIISANMGNGGDRKILNYRTGRFAASANVERMSQSREGMITAFYSYMKNPYQTFEPGFAQGKPSSRDPKLLISQSIREIAATKVGNKLRAVSV